MPCPSSGKHSLRLPREWPRWARKRCRERRGSRGTSPRQALGTSARPNFASAPRAAHALQPASAVFSSGCVSWLAWTRAGAESPPRARRQSRLFAASRHRAPDRGESRRSASRAAHATQPVLRVPAAAAMDGCHGLTLAAAGGKTAVVRPRSACRGSILRLLLAARRAQPLAAASFCGFQQRLPAVFPGRARCAVREGGRPSARGVIVGTDGTVGAGAQAAQIARAYGLAARLGRPDRHTFGVHGEEFLEWWTLSNRY